MQVTVERRGATGLVSIHGDVDDYTADELRERLDAVLSDTQALVLDLADTSMLGAAGLNVLVELAKRSQAQGRFVTLARPNPHVAKVIGLTRLADLLSVQRDLDVALAAAVQHRLRRH